MSQQEGPQRDDVRRALLGFARLVQRLLPVEDPQERDGPSGDDSR